jgi:hypothetical protein
VAQLVPGWRQGAPARQLRLAEQSGGGRDQRANGAAGVRQHRHPDRRGPGRGTSAWFFRGSSPTSGPPS